MNVQYAVKDEVVYVLEVNPRASRTVPFVSKAIGVPLAKLAAKVMAGSSLKDLGFTDEIWPKYWAIKESVFPFNRFQGQDILLSPEMKSTGEVMGLDADLGTAYAKSQMSAHAPLPLEGKIFISVSEPDKAQIGDLARTFSELGLTLYAPQARPRPSRLQGSRCRKSVKSARAVPTPDLLKNGDIQMVINTPDGQVPRADEVKIRTTAVYSRGLS